MRSTRGWATPSRRSPCSTTRSGAAPGSRVRRSATPARSASCMTTAGPGRARRRSSASRRPRASRPRRARSAWPSSTSSALLGGARAATAVHVVDWSREPATATPGLATRRLVRVRPADPPRTHLEGRLAFASTETAARSATSKARSSPGDARRRRCSSCSRSHARPASRHHPRREGVPLRRVPRPSRARRRPRPRPGPRPGARAHRRGGRVPLGPPPDRRGGRGAVEPSRFRSATRTRGRSRRSARASRASTWAPWSRSTGALELRPAASCRLGEETRCDARAISTLGGGSGASHGMAYLLVPSARHLVPIGDLDPVEAALTDAADAANRRARCRVRRRPPSSRRRRPLGHGCPDPRAVAVAQVVAVDVSAEKRRTRAAARRGRRAAAHGRRRARARADGRRRRGRGARPRRGGAGDGRPVYRRWPAAPSRRVGLGGGTLPVRLGWPADGRDGRDAVLARTTGSRRIALAQAGRIRASTSSASRSRAGPTRPTGACARARSRAAPCSCPEPMPC